MCWFVFRLCFKTIQEEPMNTQENSTSATITRPIRPDVSSPLTDNNFWRRDADLDVLADLAQSAIHTGKSI